MSFKPIKIRSLFFFGAEVSEVSIDFIDGLNIIYGGSNAGKSFTLKAIDFMLGAEKLKLPKQGEAYSQVGMWLSFSDEIPVTLIRSTKGGDFRLLAGHVRSSHFSDTEGDIFSSNNKGKTKGRSKNRSISDYLFEKIDFPSAQILKNEVGEKILLSLRMLSHYLLVGEESMVTENSPVKSPDQRLNTQDKSLFRYLITGHDDSNIVTVSTSDDLKASREGKVEILQEFIDLLLEKLGQDNRADLELRLEEILMIVATCQSDAKNIQTELDNSRLHRRQYLGKKTKLESHFNEHIAMLERFQELHTVYSLDIERLEAFEEGAFLFKHVSCRPCSVCGAEGIHHHHEDGPEDIENRRLAAVAEIAKIKQEIVGLKLTTLALNVDIQELNDEFKLIEEELDSTDKLIFKLTPLEGAAREKYELAISERDAINSRLQIFRQRSDYEDRITKLKNQKFGKQRADGLPEPIGSSSANKFSKVVLSVLEAWNFPGIETVDFDVKKQDIVVNGRDRADNGKGIRAILHSAFKVALLVYSKENNLPHPGILVLDSPLLTYRSPLNAKYGELAEDEKRLKQTSLNQAFYAHLSSISEFAQILVLENQDPPSVVIDQTGVQLWSGENGAGRQGLFPAMKNYV